MSTAATVKDLLLLNADLTFDVENWKQALITGVSFMLARLYL